MNKFVTTTTINPPTKAVKLYDSLEDWNLIVVGDEKTPKNYKLNNGLFLDVNYCKYNYKDFCHERDNRHTKNHNSVALWG